jgi:hypothetical protein
MAAELSKEFLELCQSVKAKRPRTVIDHILKHGFITTEELKEVYGYNHPPRAVRDVKEHGIPIETFRVTGKDGRKIAAYRFGEWSGHRIRRLAGRTGLSKQLKQQLIKQYGSKCFIYLEEVSEAELQIDHRIPYEVGGESETFDPNDFMLLSGSANRAKSWSCEHCENWQILKDIHICKTCYWAYPENYQHVAMKQIRRVDIVWQGETVEDYEQLKELAKESKVELPEFVKKALRNLLKKDNE